MAEVGQQGVGVTWAAVLVGGGGQLGVHALEPAQRDLRLGLLPLRPL